MAHGQESAPSMPSPPEPVRTARAGDAESAQVLCTLSGGTTGIALVSLGRRLPLGDVCKVELFGFAARRSAASMAAGEAEQSLPPQRRYSCSEASCAGSAAPLPEGRARFDAVTAARGGRSRLPDIPQMKVRSADRR